MESKVLSDLLSTSTNMNFDRRINKKDPKDWYWGCRHTVALMLFGGAVTCFMLRISLSVAMISMVRHRNGNYSSVKNFSTGVSNGTSGPLEYIEVAKIRNNNNNGSEKLQPACSALVTKGVRSNPQKGEFDWDSRDQGVIFGSYFWGYCITQIPSGLLCAKYGGKWIYAFGLLVASLCSLATPFVARLGKFPFIALRIVHGAGEGLNLPATHTLLAQWAPVFERSKIGAFVYSGLQAGTMSAMILGGFIISSPHLGGWSTYFYILGVIGLGWTILWSFFVHSTPEEHPTISKNELAYIRLDADNNCDSLKGEPIPWKSMGKSLPLWAILIAQTGDCWGIYTLLSEMPTYMSTVLHFDLKSNGLLSALPFLCMMITEIIASQIGDFLRSRKILSTAATRKLFNTIAHWIPAVAMIGIAFSGCDRFLALLSFTIAIAFNGAVGAGYQLNHIDISPNYAGILQGICNTIANLTGVAAPYVAGVITSHNAHVQDWQLVFFIAAGVYFLDNLIFLIFAEGETQSWNGKKKQPKN